MLGAVADYFSGCGTGRQYFQTVTSIQEQTLTFVPKIICVFLGMMIFGSWILTNLTEFINTLWSDFSIYLG